MGRAGSKSPRRASEETTPGSSWKKPRPTNRSSNDCSRSSGEVWDSSRSRRTTNRASPNASGSSPRWAASSPESPSTRSLDVGGGGIPTTHSSPMGWRSVADGAESLGHLLDLAATGAQRSAGNTFPLKGGSIHFARPDSARIPKRVAFVYPGLGNYFEGMGRELAALWPEVVRMQDSENRNLRDQFAPEVWWNGTLPPRFSDQRLPIVGQVTVGSLVTDILRGLGVKPDAAIGYSMGESAALVAMRAWGDRDEMLRRLQSSPLFRIGTRRSVSCSSSGLGDSRR